MKTRTILLCSVALTLGACSSNTGPRYTPRADIEQKDYTEANHEEDRMDEKSYKQYEQREPCQNYRDLPRSMVNTCKNKKDTTEIAIVQFSNHTEQRQEQQPFVVAAKPLPIIRTYTVLFDHDKSEIRSSENTTLDRAMQEIDDYNPTQVTVTGYTDSSGKAEYNQTLSHEREQAVSRALMSRGIQNQTLEREARGEFEQAVETKDGIRNQENRRVVIDFRR